LDQIILFVGDYFVYCRVFTSIPGLYQEDVTSFPVVTTKVSSHISKHPLKGNNQPPLRISVLENDSQNGKLGGQSSE
jgi:hypothetical protein